MKRIVFLGLVSLFLFLPGFVWADTFIPGPISTDTTWSPSGGAYVIDSSFSVASGTTLTIEPGTIIKARTTWVGGPSVYGRMIARGTSESPIYFTSINDDSVGGDTDGNGPTIGVPGEWQGLYFKEGSVGHLDNVIVRYSGYGGYGFGNVVGIENDGGKIDIQHSRIYDNYKVFWDGSNYYKGGVGIRNKGDIRLTDSVIETNVTGISSEAGTTTISNNLIKNNFDAGINITGKGEFTLTNNIFSGNGRIGFVEASIEFTHSGNTSEDQTNRGFEMSGIISNDTVLTAGDLPYIIQALTIKNGKTLTLEPGTLVKMSDYYSTGAIYVQGGNLIARGTKENKIYFTSLKDDSVGGDTNGDYGATSPAPKNWNAIYLENGSKADFDNAVVRYSGFNYNGEYIPGVAAAIYDRGADLSISNSFLEHNYGAAIFKDAGTATISASELGDNVYGIQIRGGELLLSQNSFHNNSNYAIYNETNFGSSWDHPRPIQTIDARNNWWGDPSGPRDMSTSTPTGSGDAINENILYIPFLTELPNSEPSPQTIDPVIIIPGIAGTELYNGDDLVWPDLIQMKDIDDYFLTENLSLNSQGNSIINEIRTGNAIEKILNVPILGVNIFESLKISLETNNYKESQNLFFFPYDWRLDLNETKSLLKQKIDEVKTKTGKEKVNIIAHSMGGLLTKAYLNSYGTTSVGKLIFVGTPHLGAPKAGKILLEGDRLSIPWLEEDRIKEIAENSPALHELLPNKRYFSYFQGYLRKYNLFGSNPLLSYEDTKSLFLNDKNGNPLMFQKAESFYSQGLDDFDFTGIETYNIVGCKTATQAAYGFNIFNEIGQTGYTSGDGTVPMTSAEYIIIPKENKFYVKDGEHAELPSTNGVRDLILGILNGNTNNLASNISNDSSFCNFKGKKLTWHSPVEIHIYDSKGNHTRPIDNNSIEYGVPGIDYDVMGHNKFIFLPTQDGQEYRIEAKGLEKGSFDLSISEIDNGEYLTTQVFNDVPITLSSIASFTVNEQIENSSIELKNEATTKTIQADSVLNGEVILDLTPPKTQIILNGKKYKDGEFKKEAEVKLEANDNRSGILGTWYSINNNDFKKYTGPFIIEKEGIFNLRYYSVDKSGNNEEIKKTEIIVGKLSKYLRKLE